MSNPPRKKGTAAETAVVRWLRDNGFGHADRQPLRGGRDQGDITACPGVVIEVKSYRLPTGVPTRGQLVEWMRQVEVERENARADVGILIVKRPGTTNVGDWFGYITAWTFANVIGFSDGEHTVTASTDATVCMTVASLSALLRAGGWGDAAEAGVA